MTNTSLVEMCLSIVLCNKMATADIVILIYGNT